MSTRVAPARQMPQVRTSQLRDSQIKSSCYLEYSVDCRLFFCTCINCFFFLIFFSRWRIGPRHRPARRAKFTHKFIPIPRGYSHRRVSTSKGISFVRLESVLSKQLPFARFDSYVTPRDDVRLQPPWTGSILNLDL